jgi:hypothetical protein
MGTVAPVTVKISEGTGAGERGAGIEVASESGEIAILETSQGAGVGQGDGPGVGTGVGFAVTGATVGKEVGNRVGVVEGKDATAASIFLHDEV